MTLPLYYYVLGTPLGVLGLIRWGCWLIRRVPAVLYRPIVNDNRERISVVVPVYQEDPDVFRAAIESWLRNGVEEVILVIDASDARCQSIAAEYPVTVLVTDVPGKRDALRKGWNHASTPIVALVDSDTIWADDVAAEVSKPFADPRIGGVGTRQSVYGSKGFLARMTDMFLDHRYFDENASQSLLGKAVSCLSGRTAVYRRSILMAIEQDFMHETFWGVPCLSGDDKRLTTLLLEAGHLTYMQRTALVWSTFPDTWRIFFKQRLRWARNTWRSDMRALSRKWVWRHPFLAYTMIDKAASGFTLLLGPTFMIISIIHQNWVFCGVLAAWWWLSRSAKLLPHLRRRPSSFLFIPGYVMFSWLMALIKLNALLTIRRQRWLTRAVAVENGQVVRTAGAAEPAAAPALVGAGGPSPVENTTAALVPVPRGPRTAGTAVISRADGPQTTVLPAPNGRRPDAGGPPTTWIPGPRPGGPTPPPLPGPRPAPHTAANGRPTGGAPRPDGAPRTPGTGRIPAQGRPAAVGPTGSRPIPAPGDRRSPGRTGPRPLPGPTGDRQPGGPTGPRPRPLADGPHTGSIPAPADRHTGSRPRPGPVAPDAAPTPAEGARALPHPRVTTSGWFAAAGEPPTGPVPRNGSRARPGPDDSGPPTEIAARHGAPVPAPRHRSPADPGPAAERSGPPVTVAPNESGGRRARHRSDDVEQRGVA